MGSRMSRPLIEGVVLTELQQIVDARGAVLHMMRCDSSGFVRFGECYFSEVVPGATKAWKMHHKQTQNLAVPVGLIRIAIYDDRKDSTSRGKLQVLEVGRPNAYIRLSIPPQLWYGFSCVSQVPALVANCADLPHEPSENEIRAMDDPAIPYDWNTNSIMVRA